ncbi:ABC transporter substrate-binding protein [Croceivirga thetidis]|uniref:ABC transporter substrate-binding protein n=1 Tax=Croceivirga thetidis TaxID=2721623 RepID=A0ABX1GSP7_9FLAO|nr:ABC transporter substrate-binding protein [Croceivirga thetidis]NKI31950.1 ABC transporter substrate-binding protein [Croceivirga thetidis]
MKVAFLLPTSDMYPALAKDFLNGFKMAFVQREDKFEFVFEGIGKAADDYVVKTAEKLLLQEEVDLTVAFCSFFQLKPLVDKFEQYQSPLIFVDLGGALPKTEHFGQFVLHHSLHLCESAFYAGQYAAKNIGKKGALLASFYDGGYQMAASYVKGFVDSGGEMVYNFVAPMDYHDVDLNIIFQELEESGADVAFTLFSYKEAGHFFEAMAKQKKETLPYMMALPLATDGSMKYTDFGLSQVHSVASWSFDDPNEAMTSFVNSYKDNYQKAPTVFALLGFETALLALSAKRDNRISFEKLKGIEIKTSPRGVLQINQNNQTSVKKHLLRKFEYNCTEYHNLIEKIVPSEHTGALYDFMEGVPYTGWRNPYICT